MVKAVQRFIHRLGFEVRKIDNYHLKPNRETHIQLGRFTLSINTRNPLSIHYTKYPGFGGPLAGLVSAVYRKYPGCSVIDIGANIGDTSALMRNAVDAPIVCIEGDPYCFGFLEKNIQQYGKTKAFRQFLGDKDQEMPARLEKDSWNTTIIPDAGNATTTLKLLTLDTFLRQQQLAADYKFLKIDTEGFDVKIIRGAAELLRASKPAIFFEYNRHNMEPIGEQGIDTLFWLRDLGYEDVLFYEDNGEFILSGKLSDTSLIEQLHHWTGHSKAVYYVDIAVFHREDHELAAQVAADALRS